MDYNIKPKPTKYNGRLYRSRLEARWAAFFDRMEWQFEYEPIDFKHWTPDFLLPGIDGIKVFLEIKPFVNDIVLKDFEIKLNSSGLLEFEDWEKEFESNNKYIICSKVESTKNPDRVFFGHQVFANNVPDEILFKYGYDISSELYNWDGLLTSAGRNGHLRKWFIEPNEIEGKNLLFEWYESANEVMFLKP